MKSHVDELKELLAIPSVSGDKKFDKHIWKAALWLEKKFKALGFGVAVRSTSHNPVVVAKRLDAGKKGKTILVYGHYDVQSPEPMAEWKSKPFEPVVREGKLYARGAADDKGQLFTWIAAVEEVLDQGGGLPVNLIFLIEGAEEIGSAGLEGFVRENKQELAADVCVLSDTHCLSEEQPLICYGLRGIAMAQIEVRTLKADVHSGIYGGNVLNAAEVLVRILSRMKDEKGKVLIPGFYEKVRWLSKMEKAELARFPWGSEEIMAETGARVVVGEEKANVAERAGARPTFEINGLWSGYIGEGTKTIVPGTAGAKVSMRLVPYQEPGKALDQLEKYLEDLRPNGVELRLQRLEGAKPVLLSRTSEYFRKAERAYKKVFGRKPVYELSGGSIGVVGIFKDVLGIDSVMMGYGLPDDGLHAPNEKLSLAMFEKGVKTNREFLRLLGESRTGKKGE